MANIGQTALLIGDSQSEPAAGADNADRLIADLRQRYPGTTPAMIGTPALGSDQGGRRSEVDTLLGRVAVQHTIPFVSLGDWMSKYQLGKFAADGVHLSTEGHQELGAVLSENLSSSGSTPSRPDCDRFGWPRLDGYFCPTS